MDRRIRVGKYLTIMLDDVLPLYFFYFTNEEEEELGIGIKRIHAIETYKIDGENLQKLKEWFKEIGFIKCGRGEEE